MTFQTQTTLSYWPAAGVILFFLRFSFSILSFRMAFDLDALCLFFCFELPFYIKWGF